MSLLNGVCGDPAKMAGTKIDFASRTCVPVLVIACALANEALLSQRSWPRPPRSMRGRTSTPLRRADARSALAGAAARLHTSSTRSSRCSYSGGGSGATISVGVPARRRCALACAGESRERLREKERRRQVWRLLRRSATREPATRERYALGATRQLLKGNRNYRDVVVIATWGVREPCWQKATSSPPHAPPRTAAPHSCC